MPPRQGVIIRCDGAADIGLGHLVRCIALADELRDKQCRVKFLVRRGDIAVKMIRKAGHPMTELPHSVDRDDTWISRVILDEQPAALVMDFRERLAPEIVWEWRRQGTLIVSIEDLEREGHDRFVRQRGNGLSCGGSSQESRGGLRRTRDRRF